MLKQTGTVDSSNIIGKKANTYSISLANILTQPSVWLSSTSDSFAVKAKRILKRYVLKENLNMDTLKSISLVSLIVVLGACSSTQETRTPKESIAFSAVKTKTSYELVCKPLNSIVVQDASWVEKCNSTAYEFLTSETKNGVKFKKEINQEPFGQAAKFAAFLLQRNPQNFEVVSLEQKYDFVSNKT